MKDNIIHFLRVSFPFLVTIFLWRLSGPVWNPAGMLAIVPIFYCTFVKNIPWFAPFGLLFCFLIDYKFETLAFWVAMYSVFYAANGFQMVIDVPRMDSNAVVAFMLFIGTGILILMALHLNWANIVDGVWLFAWCTTLYIPITEIIKRVTYDR
jgi:hypothetical protein